jgi:hypothetical protein
MCINNDSNHFNDNIEDRVMKCKNSLLLTAAFTLLVTLTAHKSFAEETPKNKSAAKESVKKQNAKSQGHRASKKVPAMRNRVYAQLARAQKLADEGDKIEGFEVLDQVKERVDSLNSYERAMLFNFYGFMYYGNDDIALAVDSFNKVISEKAIPDSLIISTLYSLAQLSMQQQDYKGALGYLTKWRDLNSKDLTSNQEMLFAQVYYQDKDFVNTLIHIEQAISLVEVKNKLPKENWLILQRATYYELKQPEQVTKVMEKLVRLYDKPQYWLQLSSMYGETGHEDKQMAVMEAAYQAGYVSKASDILTLSQLYLFHGAPVKAANLLANAIDKGEVDPVERNLDLLSRSYLSAKEDKKAIKVLMQLSDLVEQGKYDALLAQTFLNTEQWQLAITYAGKAIVKAGNSSNATNKSNKGSTKKVVGYLGNMYLATGMAHFNLKNYEQSLSAFGNASKQVKTKKSAQQWAKYVKREQETYLIQKQQQKKIRLAMVN